MSATLSLIEANQRRFDVWLCRRFGHVQPLVPAEPWQKCEPGLFSHAKGRDEYCRRCGAVFWTWTTDWRKKGWDPL